MSDDYEYMNGLAKIVRPLFWAGLAAAAWLVLLHQVPLIPDAALVVAWPVLVVWAIKVVHTDPRNLRLVRALAFWALGSAALARFLGMAGYLSLLISLVILGLGGRLALRQHKAYLVAAGPLGASHGSQAEMQMALFRVNQANKNAQRQRDRAWDREKQVFDLTKENRALNEKLAEQARQLDALHGRATVAPGSSTSTHRKG